MSFRCALEGLRSRPWRETGRRRNRDEIELLEEADWRADGIHCRRPCDMRVPSPGCVRLRVRICRLPR